MPNVHVIEAPASHIVVGNIESLNTVVVVVVLDCKNSEWEKITFASGRVFGCRKKAFFFLAGFWLPTIICRFMSLDCRRLGFFPPCTSGCLLFVGDGGRRGATCFDERQQSEREGERKKN